LPVGDEEVISRDTKENLLRLRSSSPLETVKWMLSTSTQARTKLATVTDGDNVSVSLTKAPLAATEWLLLNVTSKEQPDPRHSDGHSGPHETGAKEDDRPGLNAGSHGT